MASSALENLYGADTCKTCCAYSCCYCVVAPCDRYIIYLIRANRATRAIRVVIRVIKIVVRPVVCTHAVTVWSHLAIGINVYIYLSECI